MNGKMRFLGITLALCISMISVLSSVYFLGLGTNYINAKLQNLGINKIVPNYTELDGNVISYLKGKSPDLSQEFNAREVSHLQDVKNLINILKALVALFSLGFLAGSYYVLEKTRGKKSLKFFAKVLLHAGFYTLVFSLLAFFLMNSSFDSSFESFHRIFFKEGSYLFDPQTEMLTRTYPQELFQSLAIRISTGIIAISTLWVMIGYIMNSKAKNIK